MDNGWIKLHRQIFEWEWFDDNKTFKLFMVLLLLANHKETKWRGETVEPGQIFTGLEKLSKQTGLSMQSIRTSLKKLEKSQCVTNKSYTKYRLIKVNNWSQYQDTNKQTNKQLTNKQQTTNSIQECKELKKVKNKPKTEFEIAIDEFKKHRKLLKSPMTELAEKKLLKKLEKITSCDDEKVLVLEASIENGWKGVFELRQDQKILNINQYESWTSKQFDGYIDKVGYNNIPLKIQNYFINKNLGMK